MLHVGMGSEEKDKESALNTSMQQDNDIIMEEESLASRKKLD